MTSEAARRALKNQQGKTNAISNASICSSFLLVLCSGAFAQLQDEPIFNELPKTFKKDYLSLGILFQSVADFQIERNLSGNNGFGYLFKTNAINASQSGSPVF